MLETKLQNLTETVERLIAKLDALSLPIAQPAKVEAPTLTPSPTVEAAPEVKSEQIDRAALKSKCLLFVRENPKENKDKVKKIVSELGATTIDNVPDDKLAELKLKIEALK